MDIQMRRAIDLSISWEDYERGTHIPMLDEVLNPQTRLILAAADSIDSKSGSSSEDESAVVE